MKNERRELATKNTNHTKFVMAAGGAWPVLATTGKTTWYQMKVAGDAAEVAIDDTIGGWGISAKQFCDELKALKVGKINVHINSGGGDFFDGCAIYTALQEHPAEVTCHVDGLAASAASLVAIAGDKCLMSPAGFMMIHNVLCFCYGNAAEMRKQAELLDKLSIKTAEIYAARAGDKGGGVAKMTARMDAETWFTAEEAVAVGLADGVKDADADEGESMGEKVAAHLPRILEQYKNIPARLRRFAARLDPGAPPVVAAPKQETSMKVFKRGSQYFLKVGATEVPVPAPASKDGKLYLDETCTQEVTLVTLETPVAVAPATVSAAAPGVAVDAAQIRAQAVAEERAYRAMFNTITAAAGLSGDPLKKFEEVFYGKPEVELKLMASYAIGSRAQPLGETTGANGAGNGGAADAEAQKEKTFLAQCATEFAAKTGDGRPRHEHFGVMDGNPASDAYKAGLERYVARCRQWNKDNPAKT